MTPKPPLISNSLLRSLFLEGNCFTPSSFAMTVLFVLKRHRRDMLIEKKFKRRRCEPVVIIPLFLNYDLNNPVIYGGDVGAGF